MELKLYRKFQGGSYTIGHLYIDNVYFCDTIEDSCRTEKIYGRTAIPFGKYDIKMTVSPHFSPIYKHTVPELIKVPGFEKIRIHAGNTEKDTLGCIIVGENKKKGMVINSLSTLKKLFDKFDTVSGDETITIEIIKDF